MEGTDVFWVELWWDFFQVYVSSERGDVEVILVDFNYGLDIFRLKWRPSFGWLSSPPRIFLLPSGTIGLRNGIWFDMNLFHNSHHEVVEVRHLSRIFRIHWSDDGKLVRVFVNWETNTLTVDPHFLTFIRIRIHLIQIGLGRPLLLLLIHILAFRTWWSPRLLGRLTFSIGFSWLQGVPLVVEIGASWGFPWY